MAETQGSRKARLGIEYNGKALSQKISDLVEGFSYNDVASGSSDTISLSLENMDKKWMNEWMPQRGDSIKAKILLANWEQVGIKSSFECGTFTIDDITIKGRPLTIDVGAVSQPANEGFTGTKKTKTWEKITVKEIASQIATDSKMALYYTAKTININKIEQSKEADSSFLYSLCSKYGLAMKVYSNRLVIFDEEEYENKPAVIKLTEGDLLSWTYNTTTAGTYTGARVAYTDPDTGKTISFTTGQPGRLYDVNVSVDSKYDAELQAKARLRAENKKMNTLNITIVGNPNIIASSVVSVSGLGKISGYYYVDSVSHSLGNGYTMSLKMHKVEKKASAATNNSASTGEKGGQDYIVKSGDNLWNIAVKFYGKGMGSKYTVIYNANKEVIEDAAKKHGKSSSENGHWIYTGTALVIPEL